MKGILSLAALALGVLIFAGAARAAGSGAESNPYSVIFQHSVFGLAPPPPPVDANAAIPPPDITVNGIMTVFNRKYALFKLPAARGKSYLLGEGQSDGEIELLSVDDRSGVIKINNHGIVQTIALAKPPALSTAPGAASPGVVPVAAAGNDSRQVSAEAVLLSSMENNNPATATAPVAPVGYAIVGVGGSGNSQGGSSSSNPPSDNASNPQTSVPQTSGGSSSAATAAPEPWWVVASRNVEAARIATANLVDSGQFEPFPLTPYTPPGTPADLIGAERLYFVGAAN
jgi:hypothetical protein